MDILKILGKEKNKGSW